MTIEGLTRIHTERITTLDVDVPTTIVLNLLDPEEQSYEPEEILVAFKNGEFGQIPMEYEEDAIIGYATLELTLEEK